MEIPYGKVVHCLLLEMKFTNNFNLLGPQPRGHLVSPETMSTEKSEVDTFRRSSSSIRCGISWKPHDSDVKQSPKCRIQVAYHPASVKNVNKQLQEWYDTLSRSHLLNTLEYNHSAQNDYDRMLNKATFLFFSYDGQTQLYVMFQACYM